MAKMSIFMIFTKNNQNIWKKKMKFQKNPMQHFKSDTKILRFFWCGNVRWDRLDQKDSFHQLLEIRTESYFSLDELACVKSHIRRPNMKSMAIGCEKNCVMQDRVGKMLTYEDGVGRNEQHWRQRKEKRMHE